MHRFITAAVTATALSFSLPATSARASDGISTAEALTGIFALGVLAAMIHESSKNDSDPAPVYVEPTSTPTTTYTHRHTPKPVPQAYPALPSHCLNHVSYDGRQLSVYEANCLSQARIAISTLPKQCVVTVSSRNGVYTGYKSPCLQRNGYRTARK